MKLESPPATAREASEILGISEQRVRKLCKTKKILAQQIGRSWVIDRDSVEEYGMMSGHILAEDRAAYRVEGTKNNTQPIALSFFSGAMGMDNGIESSGFQVRLACEFDKFCRQTIAINKPDIALVGDVNECTHESIIESAQLEPNEDVDLIVGGPPCQAFSTAGKRQGLNDTRGNVFLKFLDLALSIRPKFLVIENVRGLLSCPMEHRPHDKRGNGFPDLSQDELQGGALNFILNRLKSSGYSYSFTLYNSANFGSPQIRERVIIICSRDLDRVPFLEPTHSKNGEFDLPKWKTFKQAVRSIKEHHHVNFPEKRLKYYRMLESGQNWRCLPQEIQKEALGKSFFAGGGKTGFLRRLAWNKPSPTLVTHPAMPATDLAHPTEDRPLSIEEYKRVQEFPDSWEIAGPLVQQYKQVGNAVPASLGKAVGRLIQNLLNSKDIWNPTGFPYSRYRKTSHSEWENEFESRITFAQSPKQSELALV